MPTYVYECSSCNNTFEAEQRITEAPLTSCACGAEGSVKRIIQPIAVMFKGSGFYVNDSKSSGSVPASSPKSGETGSTDSVESAAPAPAADSSPAASTPE